MWQYTTADGETLTKGMYVIAFEYDPAAALIVDINDPETDIGSEGQTIYYAPTLTLEWADGVKDDVPSLPARHMLDDVIRFDVGIVSSPPPSVDQ